MLIYGMTMYKIFRMKTLANVSVIVVLVAR